MTPEALTVPALLARRGASDGDREAIVADGVRLTYAELDAASADVASRLAAAGVVKGDRVGLLAPNGARWATLAYAVTRIGAVLVPLSTLLRPPELLAQLTTAAVTHLVAVTEFRGRHYLDELQTVAPELRSTLAAGGRHASSPSLRRIWLIDELPLAHAPTGLVEALEGRVVAADDLAVVFTSGSSGRPKGVIHTHGGAVRAVAAGLDARCIRRGERVYIPMPLFWTGGLAGGLLSTLVAGATLLTEAEPKPARTLRLLHDERVTLFRGWPDQAAKLAAHPSYPSTDLSALGDGSLPALLPRQRRPEAHARPNLFGMTETFGPYSGERLDADLPPDRRGSCGRPLAGIEVRIVDPETGAVVPAGQRGEIWLRGPNLLRGICGQPRSVTFTADGFYRTGDLGRLDDGGYLWYDGRLDEMFKVKGATVHPAEVEAALRNVAGVRQAYVVDVPGDDGRRSVGAAVVTDAALDEVIAAARDRLSAFKVPSLWLLVSDAKAFPMTASAKIDKERLREQLREDSAVVR